MAEDLHFHIDAEGRPSALNPGARALLGKSAGDWQLFQAAPDLLLLLRGRPDGLWPTLQAMRVGDAIFGGDLSEMQPSDLLNFLHQGNRTGVLLARSVDADRGIVLIDGNVAWACSTSPGERLGEMLVRSGQVDGAEVEAALAIQAQAQEGDGRAPRLGQLLSGESVSSQTGEAALPSTSGASAVAPEVMARALRHQVIEIFLGLLVLKAGTFLFFRGCDQARLPLLLDLDTEALLLDGLRRLDEIEMRRELALEPPADQ